MPLGGLLNLVVSAGEQTLPPQDMPLWQIGYSKPVILKTTGDKKATLKMEYVTLCKRHLHLLRWSDLTHRPTLSI